MKMPKTIGTRSHLSQILSGNKLLALVLLASFSTANAQVWWSFQQGDVRTNADFATVNTSGTLVTADYNSSITFISSTFPNTNFNSAMYTNGPSTNVYEGAVLMGTWGTSDSLYMLMGYDLTAVANWVGGKAFNVAGARVNLTQRDDGESGGSSMGIYSVTGTFYDESVATWNNPGPGKAAGAAGAYTLIYRQSLQSVGRDQVINPGTAYNGPRVYTYTNAGINAAIGSALANPTNKTVYFLLRRFADPPGSYRMSWVGDEDTNVVVSAIKGDTFGGTDSRPELQVAVDVIEGAPLVSVTAPDADAAENSTNTGMFTISRTVNLTNDLTIGIVYRPETTLGYAAYGIDYTATEVGSVTLPANVASTNIIITPLDDSDIEDDEQVVLAINAGGTNYGIASGSATVWLHDDNDAGALVDYMFGYGLLPHAWDTNVTAPSLTSPTFTFPFGGVVQVVSAPNAFFIHGAVTTTTNETDTVAANRYFSTTLTPTSGHSITVTNIQFASEYLNTSDPGSPLESVVFVRSSVDSFTNTLGSFTNPVTGFVSFQTFDLPLGPQFTNITGPLEFRFYVYDDTGWSQTSTYFDNLFFFGETGLAPVTPVITNIAIVGGNVVIQFSGGASDAASSFHLQSSGTVNGTYADDDSAVITGSAGAFQASTAVNGETRFYRIRR